MGRKIAYLRVSTVEQNLERQIEWAKNKNCDEIVQEKGSAIKGNLPELEALIERLEDGDELYIDGVDRLSRKGISDGLEKVNRINSKGVLIHCANGLILSKDSPVNELIALILAWVARFDAEERKRRQLAGIAKAKEQGKHLGRRPEYTLGQAEAVARAVREEGIPIAVACKKFGISRPAYYRLKELNNL